MFAQLAAQCRSQHKQDVLEELIRNQQKSNPKDPEVSYYSIVLEIERGNLLKALELLQNARVGGSEDDFLKRRLIELQAEAYSKYEHWEAQIQYDPTRAEVLPRLASRFEQEGQWDKLRRLINLEQLQQGTGIYHRMQLAWHSRDYAQIEALLPVWYPNQWEKVPAYEQKWARETLVRSLLRQGKIGEAHAFAVPFEREDQFLLLMVRLAQGEPTRVKEMFEGQRYAHADIEQDPELLPLLASREFADLRREMALEVPHSDPRIAIVLFLRQDAGLTMDRLRMLLAGEPGTVVTELPQQGKRQALAVMHDRGMIQLTSSGSPYPHLEADQRLILQSSHRGNSGSGAALAELKQHKAWLAIEIFDAPEALLSPQDDRLARSLVQKLCDQSLVAIALDEPLRASQFFSAGQFKPDSLTSAGDGAGGFRPWGEVFSGGTSFWLPLAANLEADDKKPLSKKEQRQFAEAIAKLPMGKFGEVQIDFRRGNAAEPLWLKVLRAERSNYGGPIFICELQTDSQLHPFWKAGERCRVTSWQIRQTRLPDGK